MRGRDLAYDGRQRELQRVVEVATSRHDGAGGARQERLPTTPLAEFACAISAI